MKYLDWSIIMCLFHAFRAVNEHKTSLATSEVHDAAEEVLAKALPQQLRQAQTQLLNKRGATNYTSFVSRTSGAN
jgi:hypothetical protein